MIATSTKYPLAGGTLKLTVFSLSLMVLSLFGVRCTTW